MWLGVGMGYVQNHLMNGSKAYAKEANDAMRELTMLAIKKRLTLDHSEGSDSCNEDNGLDKE